MVACRNFNVLTENVLYLQVVFFYWTSMFLYQTCGNAEIVFALHVLFKTDVMSTHIVVDRAVSSWVLTTKTTARSSTWSTRPASPTWASEIVRLMVLVLVVRLWLCVCVHARLQGYWGCAIGKAKQAAKTEIEKLQVRTSHCRTDATVWNLLM